MIRDGHDCYHSLLYTPICNANTYSFTYNFIFYVVSIQDPQPPSQLHQPLDIKYLDSFPTLAYNYGNKYALAIPSH